MVGDDDIETSIRVCYVPSAVQEASAPEPSVEPQGLPAVELGAEMDVDETQVSENEHGHTADGEVAFCRRTSDGIVDCHACLASAKSSLLQESNDEERSAFEKLLPVLDEAGSKGLTKRQLLVSTQPPFRCICHRAVHGGTLTANRTRRHSSRPSNSRKACSARPSSAWQKAQCRSHTGQATLRSCSCLRRLSGRGR